jgi:hypothetical protein
MQCAGWKTTTNHHHLTLDTPSKLPNHRLSSFRTRRLYFFGKMSFKPNLNSPAGRPSESKPRKSVRFNIRNKRVFIGCFTADELYAKWYSAQDEYRFRRTMQLDVVKCSMKLAYRQHDLSSDDFIQCIGLDQLISRNPNERCEVIKAARKAHVKVVLRAQKWQWMNKAGSPLDLARLSMASSRKAIKRSHKAAVVAATIR